MLLEVDYGSVNSTDLAELMGLEIAPDVSRPGKKKK